MEFCQNGERSRENRASQAIGREYRQFSTYSRLPLSLANGAVESHVKSDMWLQLSHFVIEDLKWLLSLDHEKFWSCIINNEGAGKLISSVLQETPPNYLRNLCKLDQDVRQVFLEIEHLIFLLFLRLSSSRQESRYCNIQNLGELLYENYFFTVPIFLDLCLFYGSSNIELVKVIIDRVILLAPTFLNDIKEVLPCFLQVLKLVSSKFLPQQLFKVKDERSLSGKELRSLILLLYDSITTMQMFLSCNSHVSKLFCDNQIVSEIVSFYSNVLPKIYNSVENCSGTSFGLDVTLAEFLDYARVDLLKIIRNIFDVTCGQVRNSEPAARPEIIDGYLSLMLELISESVFLFDYNQLYSINEEITTIVQGANVDKFKVDHILKGISHLNGITSEPVVNHSHANKPPESVHLMSLVTEVKDILPHLSDDYIKNQLKICSYDSEKVIASALDSFSSPSTSSSDVYVRGNFSKKQIQDSRGGSFQSRDNGWTDARGQNSHHRRRDSFEGNDMIEKSLYNRWLLMTDDAYDDEYDDTYDDGNINVGLREETDMLERGRQRSFYAVKSENDWESEEDGGDQEIEEEDEREEGEEDGGGGDEDDNNEKGPFGNYRSLQGQKTRGDDKSRDVVGRPRGRGQSKNVQRNRNFKEMHKSSIGNHNRKKQATRKRNQSFMPF